jgi:hypothetical protein
VNAEVRELLGRYDPDVRDIALRLRELVLEAVPDAEEIVHSRWKTIGYGLRTQVCAIAPQKSWANLQFFRAGELEDPHGLLEGTGKRMRHVKVRTTREAGDRRLAALVRNAARLAARR